ncbi:hypothetical protein IW261DRAFT_1514868 [Armillaria novae-zelandiae]|uniref:Uncharacterized protein n=1 Tax=Armillaria novae-zelandiae TaxID=153914 RepID=A0AA39U9R9_9AGAR|nr:hypothetical protein IW261DRAFT_1514868 [Armillaria novae-zelandiae]
MSKPHENSSILVLCRVSTARRWMTGDTHSQISILPRSSSSASVGPFDVGTPRVGEQARRSTDIGAGVHRSDLEVGARLVGTKDRYRGNNPRLYSSRPSRLEDHVKILLDSLTCTKHRFFANGARPWFSNPSFWPTVELDFWFGQPTGGDGRRRVHVEWREVSWSLGCGACRHYRSPSQQVCIVYDASVSFSWDVIVLRQSCSAPCIRQ